MTIKQGEKVITLLEELNARLDAIPTRTEIQDMLLQVEEDIKDSIDQGGTGMSLETF
jgi:hypothetical protein